MDPLFRKTQALLRHLALSYSARRLEAQRPFCSSPLFWMAFPTAPREFTLRLPTVNNRWFRIGSIVTEEKIMERKLIYRLLPIVLFVAGCSGGSEGGNGNPTPSLSAVELAQLEEKCKEKDEELGIVRPDGWQASSHCKYAAGDVKRVFPQDKVSKLSITMTAEDYEAMQVDLAAVFTQIRDVFGQDVFEEDPDTGDGPDVAARVDACNDLSNGDVCLIAGDDVEGMCTSWGSLGIESEDGGEVPELPDETLLCVTAEEIDDVNGNDNGNDNGNGNACTQGEHEGVCAQTTGPMICQVDTYDTAHGIEDVPADDSLSNYASKPSYFRADIEFDGVLYTSVGVRYKGASTLIASENSIKRPLRIKMDEWEDETPEITNQRMFGFQSLSLAPNTHYRSSLNQVLAAATFREYGVPAPQSSFVEVTLDIGDGPILLGLYAMTEVPDDSLLDRIFSNHEGNLYKPDGRGGHFVSFVEESFHLKSSGSTNFSDVKKLISSLNASRADRTAWRSGLADSFDIAGYIDFLAVNQIISNLDTYGEGPHNFYLYTDEQDDRMSFIPWDFNEAYWGAGAIADFTLRSFDGTWPLLQAIARDVEYATLYQERLTAIGQAEFTSGNMKKRIDEFAGLIEDAVAREAALDRDDTGSDFLGLISAENLADAIATVKQHVDTQEAFLNKFLETQTQDKYGYPGEFNTQQANFNEFNLVRRAMIVLP